MPDEKDQPPRGTDVKSREKQQGLKKHEKPNEVEKRPGSRTSGQEEGNKNRPRKDDEIGKVNGSPTPLPDDKAVESGARRLPGDPPVDLGPGS